MLPQVSKNNSSSAEKTTIAPISKDNALRGRHLGLAAPNDDLAAPNDNSAAPMNAQRPDVASGEQK